MNQAKNVDSLTVIYLMDIKILMVAIAFFKNRFNLLPRLFWDINFKN